MIISASRRTDIPAFYSTWFINRLKAGYVHVRNPFNYHQISEIKLSPEIVDCIVFSTKNPENMLDKLDELDKMGYKYYFLFTITPYDKDIERNLPPKEEIISTFKLLSEKIGSHRVIWRYDPIILTDRITKEYHYRNFEELARQLSDYTEQGIISFVTQYEKTKRNMQDIHMKDITDKDMIVMAKRLVTIAKTYSIELRNCCGKIDLSLYGIDSSKCMDDKLISKIIGQEINVKKDKNQREECGCAASHDIGTYNTCVHSCLYCYANYNNEVVNNNCKLHDPSSSMLIGKLEKEDKIIIRKVESFKSDQMYMDLN